MTKKSNVLDALLDKIMNKIPRDPLTQTQYMYYLQAIILITLLCFTFSNLYSFYTSGWNFSYFFGAILTGVFALMSVFSFRATRDSYKALKGVTDTINEEITPARIEEELKKRIGEMPKSETKSESYIG